ncbi:MAG: hypothetical protein MJ157_03430 [Clostridia bacterium]|nr:hypothetical protein [Clostridia bacterium]
MTEYANEINKYLGLVRQEIEKLLRLKSGNLKELVDLEKANFCNNLHPFLVLLAAKAYGSLNQQIVSLAAVIQYIYIGFSIHKEVLEEEKAHQEPKKSFQYPVLAGDYLCSCFFLSLCRSGMERFLEPLSQVLCQINEASLWRLLNKERDFELDLKIAEGEAGALLGEACCLGSYLTGANEAEQKHWRLFGFSLGRFLGLKKMGYTFEQLKVYWLKIKQILKNLPAGENQRLLENLLEKISGEESKNG